jgi:hypothetical protein
MTQNHGSGFPTATARTSLPAVVRCKKEKNWQFFQKNNWKEPMRTYVTAGGARYARLRLTGYYVQRMVTSRIARKAATRLLVAALGRLHPAGRRPSLLGAAEATAAALRHEGITLLGALLAPEECTAIRAWLRDQPLIDGRGSGKRFSLDAVPHETRVGDYPTGTVVDCPHILALANHPSVLGLAQHYLGFTPTITGLGLRWSFPNPAAATDNVQQFHRDAEPGSIKLLVYLTDVDAASGPHHYVVGTHRERMPLRLRPYADAEIARRHGAAREVTGGAGTAFMIDPKGIHRGAPPLGSARLVLVVEYALLPCLLYDYAPVECRDGARFDPYINRLVILPAAQRTDAPFAADPDELPLTLPE